MKYLPSKKVLVFIIILIILTIGILWFIGKKSRDEQKNRVQKYYQTLLAKNEKLSAVVDESLSQKGEISSLETQSLIIKPTVKIGLDTSTTSARAYGLELVKSFRSFAQTQDNGVAKMLSALDNKNPSDLKRITEIRIMFENLNGQLSAITAPKNFSANHKQLLTLAGQSIILLNNMEKALADPVTALQSGQLYLNALVSLKTLTESLNQLLHQQKLLTTNEQISFSISLDN